MTAKAKRAPTRAKMKRAAKPTPVVAAPSTVLVLRTCAAEMTAHGGFVWPESGPIEAPDWSPSAECGHGLHGLLWGEGDGALLDWSSDARWLVVEVNAGETLDLDGKVKFRRGVVAHCGDRLSATTYLVEHGAAGRAIVGGTATAGDRGTATVGGGGTATAGDRGTAMAGHRGTATAGDGGTAIAGHSGIATAGDGGTATAGDGGTATAGDSGTATAGDGGTATAGHRGLATAGVSGTATVGGVGTATAGAGGTATAGYGGTATAGYRGTATAGDVGTATAGYGGTAMAGDSGEIRIRWWDQHGNRYRLAVGYVGEGGIEAGKQYRVDGQGVIVAVAP